MQDDGVPLQSAAPPPPAPAGDPPATDDAKTESFFSKRVDPHFGHRVPFHSVDRTRISLSTEQASQ
jgi:hypothetical protein